MEHPDQFSSKQSLDTIALRNLELRCVIGLYHRERLEAQPLELDLELYLNVDRAVTEHDLAYSVDYAGLAEELTFLLQSAQFELLETAGLAICQFILAYQVVDRARIEGVKVYLRKPKALKGMAFPELVMQRYRQQILPTVISDYGVRYLHHSANCSLMQLDMNPGDSLFYQCLPHETAIAFTWSPGFHSLDLPIRKGVAQVLPQQGQILQLSGQGPQTLLLLVRANGLSDPKRPLPLLNLRPANRDTVHAVYDLS